MSEGVAYPLWRRIEDLRVQHGWSKLELARRADIRPATIDNLRRSTRKPQPHIIHRLADAVGLERIVAEHLAESGRGAAPVPMGDTTVKEAIRRSKVYNAEVRNLLLRIVEMTEIANGLAQPDEDEQRPGREASG